MQPRADDIVTMPSEQSESPLQPRKNDPGNGVTVSVTTCPDRNGALQVAPQLMPAGLLLIMPLPVPPLLTVSVLGGVELRIKVAVQLRSSDIVTMLSAQSALPVQPTKDHPAAGVAIRLICCSNPNCVVQMLPQEMPVGLLVTVP